MKHKIQKFSNFSRSNWTSCTCFRPDTEKDAKKILLENANTNLIFRGNGLSYSDCNLLSNGKSIDISRLNNFISFDKESLILEVQGGVTFKDLLYFKKDLVPAIIPGTLNATIAGSIANDVHGKNNHKFGSIGYEIKSIRVEQGLNTFDCDSINNKELFYATIGGLGLTGLITRVKIRLHKASKTVFANSKKFESHKELLDYMQHEGINYDFQVAWIDWLNDGERSVYSYANYARINENFKEPKKIILPKIPLKIINPILIKQFNKYFYRKNHFENHLMPLWEFNNPLDALQNWNYIYGKKGLLQFQAVIPIEKKEALVSLRQIIQHFKASPLLVVLKYFTHKAEGLLSFCEPGFCIAVDFMNEEKSILAIQALNAYIASINGKIYLAKDLFLTPEQFNTMYENATVFQNTLKQYNTNFNSDLGIRIGLNN